MLLPMLGPQSLTVLVAQPNQRYANTTTLCEVVRQRIGHCTKSLWKFGIKLGYAEQFQI